MNSKEAFMTSDKEFESNLGKIQRANAKLKETFPASLILCADENNEGYLDFEGDKKYVVHLFQLLVVWWELQALKEGITQEDFYKIMCIILDATMEDDE
ncbi:MAG: hypothetical protein E7200_04530 [Selenomonas ruminantium]|nr:hypothetical protein [Selenomonas ruminantium]